MKRSQKEPEEQDLNEITMDVEILSISESTPEVSTPALSSQSEDLSLSFIFAVLFSLT